MFYNVPGLKDDLLRCLADGEFYGVQIQKRLRRSVSFAKIYMVLRDLEEEGLVQSRQGESTVKRGKRPKMYFSLTDKGKSLVDLKRGFI